MTLTWRSVPQPLLCAAAAKTPQVRTPQRRHWSAYTVRPLCTALAGGCTLAASEDRSAGPEGRCPGLSSVRCLRVCRSTSASPLLQASPGTHWPPPHCCLGPSKDPAARGLARQSGRAGDGVVSLPFPPTSQQPSVVASACDGPDMLPRCPDSKHCENSLHSAMDAPRRGGSDVSLVPCRNGLVQLSKDTPPDNTETNEFAAISQSDVQALQCADSQENDIPQTTTCSSHQPESCHRNLDEDANGRLDGNLHDCAESRGERGGLESKENGSRWEP